MPNALGKGRARRIENYRCADFPVHPAAPNASILIVLSRTSPFTKLCPRLCDRGSGVAPAKARPSLHSPETEACYRTRKAGSAAGKPAHRLKSDAAVSAVPKDKGSKEIATRRRARSGRLASDRSACAAPSAPDSHTDTAAPLSWIVVRTFPTQEECETQRSNPWERSVASDDPRLILLAPGAARGE
jgi:hypothetical protein